MRSIRHYILLILIITGHFSYAGVKEVGNGGDLCELEYKGLIPSVVEWARQSPEVAKEAVPIDKLVTTLVLTPVKCVDRELLLSGTPKSAISYLNPRHTDVNLNRWSKSVRLAKQALVFHEGLVLIGVERTDDYHLSSLLSSSQLPAAIVDVNCSLDIQDYVTGEHLQDSSKTVRLTAGSHQQTVLLKSKNYSISVTPAGGIMLVFYRIEEQGLRAIGITTIPNIDGVWTNTSKQDSSYALSASCGISNAH